MDREYFSTAQHGAIEIRLEPDGVNVIPLLQKKSSTTDYADGHG